MGEAYPKLEVITPHKQSRGGRLAEERKFNVQVSKVSIAVANSLCQVKTFKVWVVG
jgi:hypothetical protein